VAALEQPAEVVVAEVVPGKPRALTGGKAKVLTGSYSDVVLGVDDVFIIHVTHFVIDKNITGLIRSCS